MYQRIDVNLPIETLQLLDKTVDKVEQGHFIGEAIKHYIDLKIREKLRQRLKEGAIRRGQKDLAIASEWFAVDEAAWENNGR